MQSDVGIGVDVGVIERYAVGGGEHRGIPATLRRLPFEIQKSLEDYFRIMPTGQWSEPITSGKMNASVTRFFNSSLTKK